MSTFGIVPEGATGIEAMFRGLGESSLRVYEVAMPAIHEDFQRIEARRFADEGPGWAPLTDTTVKLKRRRGMPQPESILLGTGDLVTSLAGNTENTVFEAGPAELVMGTSLPYAKYHQVGPRGIRVFGRGAAVLPQRTIIDIGPATRAKWAAIVQASLMGRGGWASVSTSAL